MSELEEKQQKDIEAAFPAVVCPVKPLGNRILVQIRLPKTKTASGLILTSDTAEDTYRNEQTAKVLKIGAGAFTFPSTGEKWPSGAWCEVGEYVRVPLHGGDNHWISIGDGDKKQLILFKTFKDYEIIGLIEGNPLDVKTNMAYF
jgi:co-chaperonin GroES (HSP10)